MKRVIVKRVGKRRSSIFGPPKIDNKMKRVADDTSKPTVGSESSSDASLSQLNDSNDDLFDKYMDRDIIDEELRFCIHHSPLHGGYGFFGEKQPSGRKPKSSNSSHLYSLGGYSNSDAGI